MAQRAIGGLKAANPGAASQGRQVAERLRRVQLRYGLARSRSDLQLNTRPLAASHYSVDGCHVQSNHEGRGLPDGEEWRPGINFRTGGRQLDGILCRCSKLVHPVANTAFAASRVASTSSSG